MRTIIFRILIRTPLTLVAMPALAAKGGMPQLDPTWIASQIFWLAITVIVLYALTSWHIIPTVGRVLTRREKALKDNISAAQAYKQEAETARATFEKAIADARKASAATIAEVQAASSKALAAQQSALDATLKEQMRSVNNTIASSLTRVKSDIVPAAASLAAYISEKLLGQPVTDADTKKHIS